MMEEQAENLKIQLYRGGDKKVDLTFKAKTASWITELIPGYLLDKIKVRGIDLVHIQELVKEKMIPQTLLEFEDDEVKILIWLE